MSDDKPLLPQPPSVNISIEQLSVLAKVPDAAAIEIVHNGYIRESLDIVKTSEAHRMWLESARFEQDKTQRDEITINVFELWRASRDHADKLTSLQIRADERRRIADWHNRQAMAANNKPRAAFHFLCVEILNNNDTYGSFEAAASDVTRVNKEQRARKRRNEDVA